MPQLCSGTGVLLPAWNLGLETALQSHRECLSVPRAHCRPSPELPTTEVASTLSSTWQFPLNTSCLTTHLSLRRPGPGHRTSHVARHTQGVTVLVFVHQCFGHLELSLSGGPGSFWLGLWKFPSGEAGAEFPSRFHTRPWQQ